MKLDPYALCKLEDVKDVLGKRAAEDDNQLIEWINAVSNDCEIFCGRKFLSREYPDEKYDGDSTDTLLLRNYPITAVSSLVIEENGAALASDEYYIYPGVGKIVLDSRRFYRNRQKIVITYTAGYTGIDGLPMALRQSIVMGVVFKYDEMDPLKLGQTSVSFQGGDQVITRTDEPYPKHVKRTWQAFKRPAFHTDEL